MGKLEDAVFADVDVEDLKVSVFGGPVFAADDRVVRCDKTAAPVLEVLAFREAGALKARAFLLTQTLDQLEVLELDEFRVSQVTVPGLEARCGLRFPDVLREVHPLPLADQVGSGSRWPRSRTSGGDRPAVLASGLRSPAVSRDGGCGGQRAESAFLALAGSAPPRTEPSTECAC
jgi:hypothetical protein